MAGYDYGYDYGYQDVDQVVDLDVAVLELVPKTPRATNAGQPLIALDDRYLVIGQQLDLNRRRVTLIARQVIYTPVKINVLIDEELWNMNLLDPVLLADNELWEGDFGEPEVLDNEELWES